MQNYRIDISLLLGDYYRIVISEQENKIAAKTF